MENQATPTLLILLAAELTDSLESSQSRVSRIDEPGVAIDILEILLGVHLEVACEHDILEEPWELHCRLVIVVTALLKVAVPCDRDIGIIILVVVKRELSGDDQHI
jgi:hypothetical protein